MTSRLAYFVPGFPTQTHGFFWDEVQQLRMQNLKIMMLSTRRPDPELCPKCGRKKLTRLLTTLSPSKYGNRLCGISVRFESRSFSLHFFSLEG